MKCTPSALSDPGQRVPGICLVHGAILTVVPEPRAGPTGIQLAGARTVCAIAPSLRLLIVIHQQSLERVGLAIILWLLDTHGRPGSSATAFFSGAGMRW